jgi:DNA-directed RNA polymerase I, II, and III subunit RPABC2
MADEDYESDIISDSDSDSEVEKPTNKKKIVTKPEEESEDETEISDDEEEDDDGEDMDEPDELSDVDMDEPRVIGITDLDIDLEEEEEEEDDDENYLQKFSEDCHKKVIDEYHPELHAHNTDEIETLSRIVRGANGRIIDPFHRTLPILSRYEKARILGERAKQINAGAEPFIEVDETLIDGYLIALKELDEKKIPFIIQRPLPTGACEYWCLKDLEIL